MKAIVYFGNDWSAENRTSSHHIARRLAEHAPLLYVEVPGLRAPNTSGRDVRKLWRKAMQAFRAPKPVGERMWCLTMPQVPFRRIRLVRRANILLGRFLVKRALRRLGLEPDVSWFTVPHAGPLAGHLGEDLVVYYCIDDYAALPNVDQREVARMDEELTRRADQVFVASSTLLEAKRRLNASVVHSPHGVDVRMFGQACEASLPSMEGARNLNHPVIGFFGLIEAWIDLDLIAYLARARPSWTFLMVGRQAVTLGELGSLPNVVFTGPQPYETLPRWAKSFDVAMVPYRLTQQVLHANPLKLREYLATGKPVVSVRTPEIERFDGCVYIAEDREAFLQSIERAMAEDSEDARSRRMQAVAEMSWERRVQEVLRTVERKLGRRPAGEKWNHQRTGTSG
jgi:glycosyltransferase involved in cell wall biosynthesis